MLLTLDINEMTAPVVKEAKWTSLLLKFFSFLQKTSLKNIDSVLSSTILKIEGSYSHIDELTPEEALSLLNDTKNMISKLESLNESLVIKDYFGSKSIKEKFIYLNQVLFKFESLLHKASYKNTPILETSPETKKGIASLRNRNLSNMTY